MTETIERAGTSTGSVCLRPARDGHKDASVVLSSNAPRVPSVLRKKAETTNRAPEDIANGIQSIDNDKAETAGEWHAINGVALKGQPTQSGIYVKDGKKVLVR